MTAGGDDDDDADASGDGSGNGIKSRTSSLRAEIMYVNSDGWGKKQHVELFMYFHPRADKADMTDVGEGSLTETQAQCEAEEENKLSVVGGGGAPFVSWGFVLVHLGHVFLLRRGAFLAFFRIPNLRDKRKYDSRDS